jgi:hypothetical protein
MSINTDCDKAITSLVFTGDLFTEIDVANEASGQGTKGWNEKMFHRAMRVAAVQLHTRWLSGELAKYRGRSEEYALRGDRELYSGVNCGPERLSTNDGSFSRIRAIPTPQK